MICEAAVQAHRAISFARRRLAQLASSAEDGFKSNAPAHQSARDADHRDGFLGPKLSDYEIPRFDPARARAGLQ
jgi:hypothetical protein